MKLFFFFSLAILCCLQRNFREKVYQLQTYLFSEYSPSEIGKWYFDLFQIITSHCVEIKDFSAIFFREINLSRFDLESSNYFY